MVAKSGIQMRILEDHGRLRRLVCKELLLTSPAFVVSVVVVVGGGGGAAVSSPPPRIDAAKEGNEVCIFALVRVLPVGGSSPMVTWYHTIPILLLSRCGEATLGER